MGMPCIIKWQDYLGVAHCAVMWAFLNASPVIRFHKVTKYKQIFKLKVHLFVWVFGVWADLCVGMGRCVCEGVWLFYYSISISPKCCSFT